MAPEQRLQLLHDHASGELLDRIFKDHDAQDLTEDLAALHNTGRIDALELLLSANLEDLKGWEFFSGQQVYCKLIPLIEAPAERIRDAVQLLVRKAGNDMAGYLPYEALGKWCTGRPERAEELVRIEMAQPEADSILMHALVHGAQIEEAKFGGLMLALMQHNSTSHQRQATLALGRTPWVEAASHQQAVDALAHHLTSVIDDESKACILNALMDLRARPQSIADEQFERLTSAATAEPGLQVIFSCSRILAVQSDVLTDRTVTTLLDCLQSIDARHEHVLRNVDVGLFKQLKIGRRAAVLKFLITLLQTHAGQLDIRKLSVTVSELQGGTAQDFGDLATEFFLSGDRSLCEAVDSIVSVRGDTHSGKVFDFIPRQLSEAKYLFLAKKAVGYLFNNPVSAFSFILSLTRKIKPNDELREILFDGLLSQYGGALRRYLDNTHFALPDERKAVVEWAIQRQDEYFSGLQSAGKIPEMHPSERERYTESQREHQEMDSAMKDAQENSILRQLMKTQVLLYGSRSISHIVGQAGSRHRTDTKLGSIGTTIELPRGLIVDPFGLDYRLRVYRAEKLPR